MSDFKKTTSLLVAAGLLAAAGCAPESGQQIGEGLALLKDRDLCTFLQPEGAYHYMQENTDVRFSVNLGDRVVVTTGWDFQLGAWLNPFDVKDSEYYDPTPGIQWGDVRAFGDALFDSAVQGTVHVSYNDESQIEAVVDGQPVTSADYVLTNGIFPGQDAAFLSEQVIYVACQGPDGQPAVCEVPYAPRIWGADCPEEGETGLGAVEFDVSEVSTIMATPSELRYVQPDYAQAYIESGAPALADGQCDVNQYATQLAYGILAANPALGDVNSVSQWDEVSNLASMLAANPQLGQACELNALVTRVNQLVLDGQPLTRQDAVALMALGLVETALSPDRLSDVASLSQVVDIYIHALEQTIDEDLVAQIAPNFNDYQICVLLSIFPAFQDVFNQSPVEARGIFQKAFTLAAIARHLNPEQEIEVWDFEIDEVFSAIESDQPGIPQNDPFCAGMYAPDAPAAIAPEAVPALEESWGGQ